MASRHLSLAFAVAAALLAGACTTFLPTQDESDLTVVAAADRLPFFTVENQASAPPVTRVLGAIEGNSCMLHVFSQNASETAALRQLRLKALALGATGIVGVTYSTKGTSLVANCWNSVTARGMAVVF